MPHPIITPTQAAVLALYGYETLSIPRVSHLAQVRRVGNRIDWNPPYGNVLDTRDSPAAWMLIIVGWENRTLTYNGHTVPDPP